MALPIAMLVGCGSSAAEPHTEPASAAPVVVADRPAEPAVGAPSAPEPSAPEVANRHAQKPPAPAPSPSAAPAGKPGLEEYRDQGFLQLGLGPAKVGLSPEMQTLAGVMAPAREQAVEVRAGQALHVTVEWQGCFSRCDTEVKASCSVEQAGPVLRVSSLFSRITAGPDVPCTEACQRQVAVCKTPKLKAGSYTVAFGEQSLSVRVPGPLDRTILHVAPGR